MTLQYIHAGKLSHASLAPLVGIVLLSLITNENKECRADEGTDFFEKKIRHVFVQHCDKCHSADST